MDYYIINSYIKYRVRVERSSEESQTKYTIMPEDRRLAAIMFTDIVGYTALMGSD